MSSFDLVFEICSRCLRNSAKVPSAISSVSLATRFVSSRDRVDASSLSEGFDILENFGGVKKSERRLDSYYI